jgi:hypothetical protein
MSDLPTAYSPIVINRVERSRGNGDSVRLRLGGQRLAAAAESELDALLIVQLRGQRHRFAGAKSGDEDPSPGSWRATFTVPDWAVPVEHGQASLWVGDASVPVPPVGTRIRMSEPAVTAAGQEPAEAVTSESPALAAAAAEAEAEAGRAGPLADALLRETVSALHAELEQRSAREAALDGALERARAELVARTTSQTELEATHGELRTELTRLVEAVAEQQIEFERRLEEADARSQTELAHARDEAERARSELAHAGGEVERARAELAQARGDADRSRRELAQARAEADHARAELLGVREQEAGAVHTRQQLAAVNERLAAAAASDQLRAQEAASLREQLAITSISRDAAVAEAGGLRAELSRIGSELAVTRERAGAGDGELGAAQQLLEDARALTAQLRGESRP